MRHGGATHRLRPAPPPTSRTSPLNATHSLPDALAIVDELTARHVKLNLGSSVYDPNDAVGRLLFNVLAVIAEFESDLIRLRTREGMKIAQRCTRPPAMTRTAFRLRESSEAART